MVYVYLQYGCTHICMYYVLTDVLTYMYMYVCTYVLYTDIFMC